MSKFASLFITSFFATALLASISSMTENMHPSDKAEMGPFLLVSPAKTITLDDGRPPVSVPQLFIGLSTNPNPNHPTPEGTFDLAFVDSTKAIKIRAKESKDQRFILEASPGNASINKGYLAVSEEDVPGLAKYRTFFFVHDPEALSRTSGKKIWYEDFRVLDKVTQPLEIGIPGQWGSRPLFGGKFALINENSSAGIEAASTSIWRPVKLQLEKVGD